MNLKNNLLKYLLFLVRYLLFRILLPEINLGTNIRGMCCNIFTIDKIKAKRFQGLLENKEGDKNKEAKRERERRKEEIYQTRKQNTYK